MGERGANDEIIEQECARGNCMTPSIFFLSITCIGGILLEVSPKIVETVSGEFADTTVLSPIVGILYSYWRDSRWNSSEGVS